MNKEVVLYRQQDHFLLERIKQIEKEKSQAKNYLNTLENELSAYRAIMCDTENAKNNDQREWLIKNAEMGYPSVYPEMWKYFTLPRAILGKLSPDSLSLYSQPEMATTPIGRDSKLNLQLDYKDNIKQLDNDLSIHRALVGTDTFEKKIKNNDEKVKHDDKPDLEEWCFVSSSNDSFHIVMWKPIPAWRRIWTDSSRLYSKADIATTQIGRDPKCDLQLDGWTQFPY